eukprot:14191475-Alexandrium_andersonii.AAC.1
MSLKLSMPAHSHKATPTPNHVEQRLALRANAAARTRMRFRPHMPSNTGRATGDANCKSNINSRHIPLCSTFHRNRAPVGWPMVLPSA